MSNPKLFNIKVEKIGRKWIQAKIQGQNYWYKGQVLINEFTQHFQIGQVYQVYGVLENKGSSYGSKFEMEVKGLTEEEVYRYNSEKAEEYRKQKEEEKAIYWIRENYKRNDYIYEQGVRALRQLGVYEKYEEEILRMIEGIKLRKAEQQRKLIEQKKQREEEFKRQKEEQRIQEEQLIQFNSPDKVEKGKVVYRKGKSLKVVKNKWVDAQSTGNESYWESKYNQDFFYIVYCEDISNTAEGVSLINREEEKARQQREKEILKKELKINLAEIVKYMKDNGKSVEQKDIKGKEVYRADSSWTYQIETITVDDINRKIFYLKDIGNNGDWVSDGKTILEAELTEDIFNRIAKLISLVELAA